MTRIDKLYAQLLDNPRATTSFRDIEKLLKAFGFVHARTKGSHKVYIHPKLLRPLPVQPSGKYAKAYQIREFLELIEKHGLYIEP